MSAVDEEEETPTGVRQRPDFAEARSAPLFTLVVAEGPDRGAQLRLDGSQPSRVLVGQSFSCELRLTDPEVSRRHASFELVGAKVRVTDLGSRNGTFVGALSVGEAYLVGGEGVRLGATVVSVERGVGATEPLLSAATSFGEMVGASAEMRRLYPLCEKLAAATVSVIIEGETGTGKEVLAESLHTQGPRARAPFVVFDCTAVPPSLLESELFGHERGAFTGAVNMRKGVFERANGGTLLIDEIGDLDLALQPKLLRALERAEIQRVGGESRIKVDVRIVAATRRDLDQEVQAGVFRDDLFHRLAVARIDLPPLRDRHGDIAVLARHFARKLGQDDYALDADLIRRWEGDPWPGNVRELRNAVARHLALGELAAAERPPKRATRRDLVEQVLAMDLPIGEARERIIDEFERRYVAHMLAKSHGVVSHAAKASGVARRHFQRIRARQT